METSNAHFKRFASSTSNGRNGTVTVICPKCSTKQREYQAEVNAFNEWSWNRSYDSKEGRFTFSRFERQVCDSCWKSPVDLS